MHTERTPVIFDRSDGQNLRVNMIGSWLKKHFGRKIIKLSVDGGFTCPNRDGTKGRGGCLFCSARGSGDMASSLSFADTDFGDPGTAAPISSALSSQIDLLSGKWPQAAYMAYFQNYTNTYGPLEKLRALFLPVLEQPDVVGLAIATRPDCISEEVLALLEEINQKTFLWVELGLQSIHRETMEAMNLCYTLEEYEDAISRLHRHGIAVVTHLILGLPGETEDMMLESVKHVCRPHPVSLSGERAGKSPKGKGNPFGAGKGNPDGSGRRIFGLKLHMLNTVKSSRLPQVYPDYVPFRTMDEYTDLVVRCLEIIPPQITIHRLSGDAPRPILISPEWSWKKHSILNEIHRKLRQQNTWQGRLIT